MNVKEEDVFLILFADKLRRAETSGYNTSYAELALIVMDSTAEVMSVVNKMSKSSVTETTIS